VTNQEIATVFRKIADRLQLEGANPYRIRAYRKAATNIDHLKDPAARLAEQGGLRQIPGVGKDLEQKIHELLKTGTINDPVKNDSDRPGPGPVPFGLPGLDPQMARWLHRRFHLETLDDLERLARSRFLRTLPGLGLQLERDILNGLDNLKRK
jgi:DNA polymerase (family X)